MLDETWIEHRREDAERIGWIRMVGEKFIAIDVLGREVTGEVDWVEAEEALEEQGLSFLAEPWSLLRPDDTEVRVRITEVSSEMIRVIEDELGAASAVGSEVKAHELPFPAPSTLRPLSSGR